MAESRWNVRFGLGSLLLIVLAVALAMAAWRRFQIDLLTLNGVAAGAMMFSIGVVVGHIVGAIATPRYVVVCLSVTIFYAITQGFFDNEQELTLLALTMMSIGLLIGALDRTIRPSLSDEQPHGES